MKSIHQISIIILIVLSSVTNAVLADKPRLAIQEITATDSVVKSARSGSQIDVLNQILQGADTQLANTINQTKRFDIVARSAYKQILKEQKIAASGDVNPNDPQIARAFKIAGAKYVATVIVDNYQDIAKSASFEGGYGQTRAERRTIQIQATLQIYDTTTAVMLSSTSITFEDSEVDEKMSGTSQSGRGTNSLIGRITKQFAIEAANAIMDNLAPAKVLQITMGNITLNRGAGTGIEVGQFWQVFHAGEELIDPDTGETLGSEEVPIGWAQITAVLPKFSKAIAIQNYGINKGSIIRHSKTGLPSNLDPEARPGGSSFSTGVNGQPADTNNSTPRAEQIDPAQELQERLGKLETNTNGEPIKLAIFIRTVAQNVNDSKAEVLETYITSWLTDQNITVINRAEVLNAVSNFTNAGANNGTGKLSMTDVERLLSDQASAAALSRNLGADAFLVATITSFDEDRRDIDDERGTYSNIFYTLDITWNVIDGGTGGSIASGLAQASDGIRHYSGQKISFNIDRLLREDAELIGYEVRLAMANPETRKPTKSAGMIPVQIHIALSDLSIPELIKQENGEYIVGANRYQLEPMACSVLVDGMIAGTAPGVVEMSAGTHRIRIERPMITPVDQFMVVREGMSVLTIPIKLSDEGSRQWKEQARFFEQLKTNAVLREAELEKVKGMAEFLRNSKIEIDTTNLNNLGVNTPNVWLQLLDNQ